MKNILFVLTIIVFSGCFLQKKLPHNGYIEYHNSNQLFMSMDGTTINDKLFSLKIPLGMRHEFTEVSNVFLHTLKFDHKQEIIVLYDPFQNQKEESMEKLAMGYNEFKKLYQNEQNLKYLLREKHFLRKRLFGIQKDGQENITIIYINVKKDNLPIYNSSIKSFSLENNKKIE